MGHTGSENYEAILPRGGAFEKPNGWGSLSCFKSTGRNPALVLGRYNTSKFRLLMSHTACY